MFVSTIQIPANSASTNFTGACFTLGKGGRAFAKGSINLSMLSEEKRIKIKSKLSTETLRTLADIEIYKKS